MRLFKRIQALALAAIMAVMTIGTVPAFAAEISEPDGAIMVTCDESGIVPYASATLVDQTFNMSYEHTGSTRRYNYDSIWFDCVFTKQDGSALTDRTILAVRLYDATTGTKVNEWQDSSGRCYVRAFPIDRTHRYYFQYCVAYGTPNLKIHMKIQTYVPG